ncbi:MAG: copper amine oxidase N-terminal domain-containing protein [Syntrophomonadaceae bacterium]|jgi:hypothetical protein|nr:copper amine oxidase N-terminal domain-containing protein [Syntrophomonadaceae bacterium]
MKKLLVLLLAAVIGLGAAVAPVWADEEVPVSVANEEEAVAAVDDVEVEPISAELTAEEAEVISAQLIKAYYDGSEIIFDQPPVIEEGRTLVPARAIFEKLGLTVSYDEATKVVTAKNDQYEIILTIDQVKATVNGEETILDVPAKILGDRTMVPIRFISESIDLEVAWDNDTRTINITTKTAEPVPPAAEEPKDDFTGDAYLNFPALTNYVKYAALAEGDYTVTENTASLLTFSFAYSPENTAQVEQLQKYYELLTAADWAVTTVEDKNQNEFTKDGVTVSFTIVEDNTVIVSVAKIAAETTEPPAAAADEPAAANDDTAAEPEDEAAAGDDAEDSEEDQ